MSALEKYMDILIMLRGDAALKTIMELNENDTLERNFVSHREELGEANKNGSVIENDTANH
eukprot:5231659-Ditylum_brightwellii.AAC.1